LFYAHLLSNLGRNDEAVAEIRRARELEPASLITNAVEGQILFFAGDLAGSEESLRRTIDLDGNFWLSHLFIARLYLKKGQYDEAISAARRAAELSGGNSEALATAAFALGVSGRQNEAREILNELTNRAGNRYVPSYAIAQIYLALGDRNKALELLERALNAREALMVFLKVEPKWDAIRADPRFVAILTRMKFY
jgi:tetratricopeptide (TPR) repeat protein